MPYTLKSHTNKRSFVIHCKLMPLGVGKETAIYRHIFAVRFECKIIREHRNSPWEN